MKSLIYKFAPIILGSLLLSCAAKPEVKKAESPEISKTEETSETKETNEVKTAEVGKEVEVNSRYNYDRDWEIIKTQIVAKNESEIKDWIRGSNVSAEDVLMIFSDPNVLKALEATSYKDLKTETIDEDVFLKFYYEETGMDDEGNETGMSVTMYMFQGEPNFQIDHIIAAG